MVLYKGLSKRSLLIYFTAVNVCCMPKKLPNANHRILGERIRSIRISQGYTSHESFANKYEISRTQYARYEKGMNISFDSLVRILGAFDMEPKEFFGEGFEELKLR